MPKTYPIENPITIKFDQLRAQQEGALIAYLTGGDPDPKNFLSNASAIIEGGTDIVEIGIPFSDPIADGPIIQASSKRALQAGTTPGKVLELIKALSVKHNVPFVVLTYYNPVLAMGTDVFLKTAKVSGVSGIVVPDLPAGEDDEFRELTAKYGINNILLAAPNTPQTRLRQIIAKSTGFLYLVSLYGVTGPRETLSSHALETLERVKPLAKGSIPIVAGFGISQPDQVTTLMKSGADGAIVGSALVKTIQDHLNKPDETADELKNRVSELKRATRYGTTLAKEERDRPILNSQTPPPPYRVPSGLTSRGTQPQA